MSCSFLWLSCFFPKKKILCTMRLTGLKQMVLSSEDFGREFILFTYQYFQSVKLRLQTLTKILKSNGQGFGSNRFHPLVLHLRQTNQTQILVCIGMLICTPFLFFLGGEMVGFISVACYKCK